MMAIPDDIKENIRAVLLSKTDGTGIFVSQFFKDYKSFVQQPLVLKKYGYDGLESFFKDIPDVCRLEYSDKHMAYRLFGITKPNTFVSSFVKKAAAGREGRGEGREGRDGRGEGRDGRGEGRDGRESRDDDSSRRKKKGDRIAPPMDLNERWEPNERGHYSLCFPNKSRNGLDTREAVALKFAQVGEVVDINIIARMTFVRYSDENAAKKAVELFGEELGLRRAEERSKSDKKPRGDNPTREDNSRRGTDHQRNQRKETVNYNNNNNINNDEEWDDEYKAPQQQSVPGGYSAPQQKSPQQTAPGGYSAPQKSLLGGYSAPQHTAPGGYPNTKAEDIEIKKSQAAGYHRNTESSGASSKLQVNRNVNTSQPSPPAQPADHLEVYIGNWPSEASEVELQQLLTPYTYQRCRLFADKGNNRKKYAFVDCDGVQSAQEIINNLDKTMYLNRCLQVRFGKKSIAKGTEHGNIGGENKLNRPDVEQNSASLHSRNNGILPSPSIQHVPKTRHVKTEERMPKLESIDGGLDMPPLENIHISARPGGMPALENSFRRPGGMPALENSHRRPGGMPALENISPSVMTSSVNGDVTSGQLNVGNFPYGTVERELMDLFYPFGARSIQIMNSEVANRSTYAFVNFMHCQEAVNAMQELDQSLFKNRKLVVTLSNTYLPQPEPTADTSRLQHPDTTLSQISPIARGAPPPSMESVFERSLQPNRDNFNFQRLTGTLYDYSKIATRLRANEHYQFIEGMSVKVMITHVENQKFFWGQILQDSENGPNVDLQTLQKLSEELQVVPKVTTTDGLGRCMAKYENEWFRAWATCDTQKNGQVYGDLIFIDYGNRSFVPKSETYKTNSTVWHLPPMAKPFKLKDVKYGLEDHVDSVVVLEIIDPGSPRNNFVSTVQPLQWTK